MTGWARHLSSADWEIGAPLPRGMRHPAPGEVEKIIRRQRKALRKRGVHMDDPIWLARVSKSVDAVCRKLGIFVEGA